MSEVPKFYIKAYSYAEALTPPTRRQGDADYWTPSPNNSSNLFYNLGNIGIGIANPQQKLHLEGNMYVSGSVGIGVTIQLQH